MYSKVVQRINPELTDFSQQMPTVATDLVTSECRLMWMLIANNGVGAANITVKDKDGTPTVIVPNVNLNPRGTIAILPPDKIGIPMVGGINVVASASGVSMKGSYIFP